MDRQTAEQDASELEQQIADLRRLLDVQQQRIAALETEHDRLLCILNSIPAMIFLQRADDTLLFANRPFYERLGEVSNGLCDISYERVSYVAHRTIDGHAYQFHHAHCPDVGEASSILTVGTRRQPRDFRPCALVSRRL